MTASGRNPITTNHPFISLGFDVTAEPSTRVIRADSDAVAEAARCLAAGGLVAFPTETVYGLGADAARRHRSGAAL